MKVLPSKGIHKKRRSVNSCAFYALQKLTKTPRKMRGACIAKNKFSENYSAITLTNFLPSALRSNLTVPFTSAKSVSSLPIPTPAPG